MNESMYTVQDLESLILVAKNNLNGLLNEVFHHTNKERAVVVYDTRCRLSNILMESYKQSLPDAIFVDFDTQTPESILEILTSLQPSDFVALVQSTSFRLDAFRLRVELFKRQIKVIEHPHLSRMSDDEAPYYINSLAYDSDYYRYVGRTLKSKIDSVAGGVLDTGGELLVYGSPFESAKLNIGDYTDMTNTGGQFPLGEVFTEAQDLRAVNGRVKIFSFGDVTYKLNYPKTPITLIIEQGQVIDCENSTPAFDLILSNIRRDEGGVVWVRELGLGLNRAFSKKRTVADTGTYERMCGVHLSLGAKHGIYGKPGFKRRDGTYHVDVFADTQTFTLGDEIVYSNGAWTV
jgi:aminopeptidase